ncbi:MAG: hypothetical protein DRJ49_01190 [Thermoprotei archaeon]|nr:MAG: hypothetical protein DRN53_07145 [Thermoprotei archaeon]RLE90029.1 MAG: hypothetical protein DRJ49_01190 [Thermoprotei archaeon]
MSFDRGVEVLPELIYHALENRSEIEYKLNLMKIDESEVLKKWLEYKPSPAHVESIGAVDGSMNFVEFHGFILYAVSSLAITYTSDDVLEDWINEVDLLYPYEYTVERIRMYMNILESKVAIKALEYRHPEILLLDGSILSHFSKRAPYIIRNIPRSVVESYLKKHLSDLDSHIQNNSEEIYSKKLFYKLIHEELDMDTTIALAILFEFLEYYRTLIRLISTYATNIVAIAKTSVSRRVFRKSIKPDLVVFNSIAQKCGFSNPEIHSARFVPREIGLPSSIEEFSTRVTVFYCRLERGERVYRVELLGERGVDDIKHIMDMLESISVKGYPYPLYSVHKKVEITNLDMDKIKRIMGISERSVRERW